MFKKKITYDEILQAVRNNTVTGFILCDVTPTEGARKFERINWPPIFTRDEVKFEDLPNWMKELTNKRSFPRKTLLQTMRAKQVLVHTKLAEFYLRNGFEIINISSFIEYEASKCFCNFYDMLYRLRVQATIEKNSAQTAAIKLTGNAPYGKVYVINSEIILSNNFIVFSDHSKSIKIFKARDLW